MDQRKIIPVILCGGSGIRLWPLSSKDQPKQYLPLLGKTILLHDTLQRAIDCTDCALNEMVIVTTKNHEEKTIAQVHDYNPSLTPHILLEPEPKNTSAAIAYAVLYAKNNFGENTILWILPSDHFVEDHSELKKLLRTASIAASHDKIVTFGITPTSVETEYGYIKPGSGFGHAKPIKTFTEKPDTNTAEKFYQSKNYLWNSGMFLASAKTYIDEFIEHAPEIISPLHEAHDKKTISLDDAYKIIPNKPFDKAIMEKIKNGKVIKCNIGWSDLGSWRSIWTQSPKDEKGNALKGDITTHDSNNCLIHVNDLVVAAVGLQDLAIVEHNNRILIADKNNAHAVKDFLNQLNLESPKPKEIEKIKTTKNKDKVA